MKIFLNHIVRKKYAYLFLCLIPVISACSSNKHSYKHSAEAMERRENFINRIYERWDLDNDSEITCDDAEMMMHRKFKNTDLDGDSLLVVEEFQQAKWSNRAFAAEHLFLFDQNRNGQVTLEEFLSRPDPKFTAMDKNGDCLVTKQEITQMVAEDRGGKGGKRGGKKGRGKRGGDRGEGKYATDYQMASY